MRRMVSSVGRAALAAFLLLAAPAAAFACLWDYDTLRQERAQFPTVLELITGKFLRHSPEFYQWRIIDRVDRLKMHPADPALLDDLAVAYEKTGQHALAVETMETKERLVPGLYETYSNLGTFHILNGDLEQGLPLIDKALAINPDAHFGRERYQKWLVEYALSRRDKDGKIQFPLNDGREYAFATYLAEESKRTQLPPEECAAAIKGILGMMRFANHKNPLLLEALGDLLWAQKAGDGSAGMLAARCYLQASYVFADDKAVQDKYRELAGYAAHFEYETPLDQIEADLLAEQADADAWYAELAAKEAAWIANRQNPEAEFDKLYTAEPEVVMISRDKPPSPNDRISYAMFVLALIGIGLFVLFVLTLTFALRRRFRTTSAT